MTDRPRSKTAWSFAASLFLVTVFSMPALAQDCTPDDIVLDSQADVDNFQANHGPCDTVDGRLTIDGDDIVNLGGLAALDEVGDLIITNNPLLINIDDLSGLTNIFRDLEVSHNETWLISTVSRMSPISAGIF